MGAEAAGFFGQADQLIGAGEQEKFDLRSTGLSTGRVELGVALGVGMDSSSI
jgi:hypothetical protein